ncbi:DUF4436 family protein [Yinghuangia soli]|uniref:DUF4436 domain-containing protein n=1 Tax=Yinghuangia soli TaxID=2908204 RepID=A0AA41TZF6_9ACTN|nr:DUF4436 family protein [Yinghuangia soli]MCF2527461.1 DUF4436 domain-containing protein [Yinghuangia soli]
MTDPSRDPARGQGRDPDGGRRHGPGKRRRIAVAGAVAAVVAAVLATGVWLQFGERADLDTRYRAVPAGADADRVDVTATVVRVDAAARELVLRVLVTPRGALAEDGGLAPAVDLALQTSPQVRGDLNYRAHTRIATTDLAVALSGGSVTDYPFDDYRTSIEVSAQADGRPVPVDMTLGNSDALFSLDVDAQAEDGAALFDVGVDRSTTVLVFAVFMMAAMWALAVSVAIATRILVAGRRGLVWPALGWMAATLFALAAFRNTAPGNPPLGSLLDYLAFLWAEAVIAACLTTAVLVGAAVENRPAAEAA